MAHSIAQPDKGRTRKPLTLDEHRAIGAELRRQRQELWRMADWLRREHLPVAHPAVRSIEQAIGRLDKVRSAMENQLFKDCPPDGDATAPGRLMTVYYGG